MIYTILGNRASRPVDDLPRRSFNSQHRMRTPDVTPPACHLPTPIAIRGIIARIVAIRTET